MAAHVISVAPECHTDTDPWIVAIIPESFRRELIMGGLTKEEIAQIQAVCRAIYPRSNDIFEPEDAIHIARLFGARLDVRMMGACVSFNQLISLIERLQPNSGMQNFALEVKKLYDAVGGLDKPRLNAADLRKLFMHSGDDMEDSMLTAMVQCMDTTLEEADFDLDDLTAFLGKASKQGIFPGGNR